MGGWLDGKYSERSLAPADLVRGDVHRVLAGDSLVADLFADRVTKHSPLPRPEVGFLPSLGVCQFLVDQEPQPGWIAGEVSLLLVVRLLFKPYDDSDASVCTLLSDLCDRLILPQTLWPARATDSGMVNYAHTPKLGAFASGQVDLQGGCVIQAAQQVTWKVPLNNRGRPSNLVAGGGW